MSLQLVHGDKVEEVLQSMDAQKCFTFAVSCQERQWPIYQRASAGKPWEKQTILRSSLDAVWDYLAGRGERPSGFAEQCELAIFDDGRSIEDGAAFYVTNYIYGLLWEVENNIPRYCIQPALGNLDLLNTFLYDHLGLQGSDDDNVKIDNHELMQKEMKRQFDDLALLENELTPDLVDTLRKRSEEESILGDYWYKE